MFLKKREVNLFTEIVQSLSKWSIKLILVKQKDWKTEFFQPHWTMSNEQHLHMASLLDRTSMAGFKIEPDQARHFQETSSASLSVVFTSYCYPLLFRWFSVAWQEKNYKRLSIYNGEQQYWYPETKKKLSQQPVTVKSVAPSTVHANDWPTSPAKPKWEQWITKTGWPTRSEDRYFWAKECF